MVPPVTAPPYEPSAREMARSSEVLPAPFDPRTATTEPACDLQRHVAQRLDGAVVGDVEVLDAQQWW